jgi:apolipoprotein D and lipocalin family protein
MPGHARIQKREMPIMTMHRHTVALALAAASVLAGCATPASDQLPKLTLASHVELKRFMGDWYVIANIPTFAEKGAHNAKEHYDLAADGTIPTTFTFNADASDGPLKRYESRAYVQDKASNAVWGEQYVWPIKADYRISYVSDDYQLTVVTREKRDHVWIMARTPSISEADYQRLSSFVASQGYEVAKLQRVPQDARR